MLLQLCWQNNTFSQFDSEKEKLQFLYDKMHFHSLDVNLACEKEKLLLYTAKSQERMTSVLTIIMVRFNVIDSIPLYKDMLSKVGV